MRTICSTLLRCLLMSSAVTHVSAQETGAPDPPTHMEWLKEVWAFTLFTVDGAPIGVSQVVIAVGILIVGIAASRFFTYRLKRSLIRAGRLEENTAAILERAVFYGLIVVVVISSLQMVSIPMTVFTFLGGAVAIGVGFGAQNIFNNFISGLILMTEQPVRLGDMVEIDSYLGRVSHIGARCTRIRRIDGIEILVPNSTLLENNLVNRTLSDKVIRTEVSVGVAYGSPVQKVQYVLREIAEKQAEVLSDPPPQVLFEDFGDSALLFTIYLWVEIQDTTDLKVIRSDVRFAVDERFREAGITIAFPQRDIHVDGKGLRVELVDRRS